MNIRIWIHQQTAVIAIAHHLHYGGRIRSRQNFKVTIGDYISLYGTLCIDDHEGEYAESIDLAKAIVEKYYQTN
jgi:hypothetical protein